MGGLSNAVLGSSTGAKFMSAAAGQDVALSPKSIADLQAEDVEKKRAQLEKDLIDQRAKDQSTQAEISKTFAARNQQKFTQPVERPTLLSQPAPSYFNRKTLLGQ